MSHRRATPSKHDARTVDDALEALGADQLRALVRDVMPWLDEATRARLLNALVDRAARGSSGWVPEGPSDAVVAEIAAFAADAQRVGYADPEDVEDYLHQGWNAFLRKDYLAAGQVFRALLIPIGSCAIDLGQREMVDDVLCIDVAACACQYVVCAYMLAVPERRGDAVLSAVEDVREIGHFWEPLREMEAVAVEPLPGFDEFLEQWRALLDDRSSRAGHSGLGIAEDGWLREVVQRTQGPQGLAEIARASRRAEDLRAWCRALIDAGDWEAALAAYGEAAEVVADKQYARADFLDGAALAAQELGRKNLPQRLERAWRARPSLGRLRRWLGSSKTKRTLRKRVADALEACPRRARRQRGLLHVLDGDFRGAARVLASAPGLGWSGEDHPGHLLFPLLVTLLRGEELPCEPVRDFDEVSVLIEVDEPRLATPSTAELLELAGVTAPEDAETREAVFKAMRKSAHKRIAGVTGKKRRAHYGHAASLAVACASVDDSAEARAWLDEVREKYRRYPALQRELNLRAADALPGT